MWLFLGFGGVLDDKLELAESCDFEGCLPAFKLGNHFLEVVIVTVGENKAPASVATHNVPVFFDGFFYFFLTAGLHAFTAG